MLRGVGHEYGIFQIVTKGAMAAKSFQTFQTNVEIETPGYT